MPSDDHDPKDPPTSPDDLAKRRARLRGELAQHEATRAREERQRQGTSMAGYAAAFRLSTEFVAAIVVGGVIGYFLDYLLGTLPWLLILFLLLGFVAGILNVLRSAGLIQGPQAGKRPGGGGDDPA